MDRLHDGCCHCPQVRHLSLRGVGSPNINGQHRPSAAGVDGGVVLSSWVPCCVFSLRPRIHVLRYERQYSRMPPLYSNNNKFGGSQAVHAFLESWSSFM